MHSMTNLILRVMFQLGLLVYASSSWAESPMRTDVRVLVDIVQTCVDHRDSAYPVFNGCIDWHSAVHGHWALLWGSYLLDDKPLADAVLKRFDPQGLDKELRLIRSADHAHGATFEMPYGRAWFLQLARDAEQLYGFHGLRPLADYLYPTLLDYARRQGGDIAATDYQNASWYLYQLYEWAVYNGYEQDQLMLRKLINRRYSPPISWPAFHDNQGFFAPSEMAALLLTGVGKPEPDWQRLVQAIKRESLTPLQPPFAHSHQAGLDYSRTWGLLALAHADKDERFNSAANRHRQVMRDAMTYWAQDYKRFGHWVAQFGLFSYRIEFAPNIDATK